ncbi:MAG: arsinothricin resistance N-acetyltransferase ArsN1 family A [Candidatus Rokuibacteriota bacterium]
MTRSRVLFLCTHNSARSQMAEGFLHHLAGDRFEVASAGTEATRVHPLAIEAMNEIGIDIRAHRSKTVESLLRDPWDYVITVCDSAHERCPVFPGRTARLHWSFEDPSQAGGSEAQRLEVFRRVRDQIRGRVHEWLATSSTTRSLVAMTTRVATLRDAAAIARIYNHGIEERIATFETEPRTREQIEAQLAEKGDRYPTMVVERNGDVVAFAGAGPYRTREAYAGVAEHSVYTAREARGTGAGRVALDALIRKYESRGFWKLVSRIFPENRASLILHERAGFRVVGVYQRHGRLAGEWRDCVIVERLLGEAARD